MQVAGYMSELEPSDIRSTVHSNDASSSVIRAAETPRSVLSSASVGDERWVRKSAVVSDEQPVPMAPGGFADPSRRTYLAAERTLLAWWRTGFSGFGVALALGRLIPDVANLPRVPFLALGGGWAALAAVIVLWGSRRHRLGRDAIDAGGFLSLDDRVARCFAISIVALIVASVVMVSGVS